MSDAGHPRGLEDALLVLRAQTGNDHAFERLFTRHEARLLYYLRRITDTQEAAEDAFQEAWLRAYRKIGSLDEPRAFRAWLYRIGRNVALDALRRGAREVPLDEAGPESLAAPLEEREESFDEADVAVLHQALERIDPLHREALTLRFLEDFSYAEIAHVVDCPLGTVRSRLHNGRRALRRAIENVHREAGRSAKPETLHDGGER